MEDRVENERLQALDLMTTKLSSIYPNTPSGKGGLTLRISHGRVEISNTSGQTLTQLTFWFEGIHLYSAPENFSRRFYFVPKLEAGQKIYLSPVLTRNILGSEGQRKHHRNRPQIALVPRTTDEAWLTSFGGLLSAKLSYFSTERHELNTPVTFPEIMEAAMRYELDNCLRVIATVAMQGQPSEFMIGLNNLVGDHGLATKEWAQINARRLRGVLPSGTPLADEAALIADQPGQVVERALALVKKDFLSSICGVFIGTFELKKVSVSDQAARGGNEVAKEKARAEKQDSLPESLREGAMIVEITGLNANGRVEAWLSDPDKPQERRAFLALVPEELFGGITLQFRTTSAPRGKPEAHGFNASATSFSFRISNTTSASGGGEVLSEPFVMEYTLSANRREN